MRVSRIGLTFMLLFAALGLAGVAAAAEAPRAAAEPDRNSPESIRALHLYAECVARDHWSRPRLRAILAQDFREQSTRDALRDFVGEHNRCVAPWHSLSAASLLFVGALAEELLARTRDLPRLVAYDPAHPAVEARNEAEMMSLCVVRTDPAAVAALLATAPASAEERAALGAITPRLGQCLRRGAHTRVNALEVRALVAFAAWRLAEANSGTSAANGEGARPHS